MNAKLHSLPTQYPSCFFFFFWQPRHLVSGLFLQVCEYMFNLSFVSFCKCPNTHSMFASFLLASVQIHIGSSLHFFNKYSILFSFLQVCEYIFNLSFISFCKCCNTIFNPYVILLFCIEKRKASMTPTQSTVSSLQTFNSLVESFITTH